MKKIIVTFFVLFLLQSQTTVYSATNLQENMKFIDCYTLEFCMFNFQKEPPPNFDESIIVLVRDVDVSFRLRFGCTDENFDVIQNHMLDLLSNAEKIDMQGLIKKDNRISAFLFINGRSLRDWIVMKQFKC